MAFILSLLMIAALIVFDLVFPFVIFIAAWGAVIVVLITIAIVVGLITHLIDDPGSEGSTSKALTSTQRQNGE